MPVKQALLVAALLAGVLSGCAPTSKQVVTVAATASDLAPGLHHCEVRDPSANENGMAASWADTFQWAGRNYRGTEDVPPGGGTGRLVGRITCDVSTSGLGAGHHLQDGDATFPAGTAIYELVGTPQSEALVARGRVYRVLG